MPSSLSTFSSPSTAVPGPKDAAATASGKGKGLPGGAVPARDGDVAPSPKRKKTKKIKKAGKTLITLLLDRSGSMWGSREATLEAINGYVDGLRVLGADARFSLIQFATAHGTEMVLEKTCETVAMDQVPVFTPAMYSPSGGTPLLDAVMAIIDGVEEALRGREGIDAIVAIQTDGEENASTRWSWEEVRARVARKTEEGWSFVFLGAGLQAKAYEQSGRLGIAPSATMSYRNDRAGTRAAFAATADSTLAYALGESACLSYSAAQKSAAGDDVEAGARSPRLRPARLGGAGGVLETFPSHEGLCSSGILKSGLWEVASAQVDTTPAAPRARGVLWEQDPIDRTAAARSGVLATPLTTQEEGPYLLPSHRRRAGPRAAQGLGQPGKDNTA